MIYFLRGLVSGLWKVGFSGNVRVRASTLASAAREPVEVVAVIPGGRDVERSFHRALAASCAHEAGRGSEWYRDDGAVARIVAGLPAASRGSYVVARKAGAPRARRSPAELAAARADRHRQYVAEHGHEPWQIDGCARCRAARARYGRLVARKSPLLYRPRREMPAFLSAPADVVEHPGAAA